MKGFTLIESMVAIAIVTIAIAGPMYATNRAIVAAETASNQFVAAYLAQEGIEYIRSMRDDAYLYHYGEGVSDASIVAWADFSTNSSSPFSIWQCEKTNPSTNACTLDPLQQMGTGNDKSLNPCKLPFGSGNDCAPLYLIPPPSNIYTQGSSPPNVKTPFTRTIQVSTIPSNEVSVVSTVSWDFHNAPYSVSVTDHLTPWQ